MALNCSMKESDQPVRKTKRIPRSVLEKMEAEFIQQKLLLDSDNELGLEVMDKVVNKGRGVKTLKYIKRKEFVCEYAGKLLDSVTAKHKEETYSKDSSKGCFMYFFEDKGKKWCIDATDETGRYGRLINHDIISPNLVPKVFRVHDKPRLIFLAKTDISPNTELSYDYGERNSEIIKAYPWLTNQKKSASQSSIHEVETTK